MFSLRSVRRISGKYTPDGNGGIYAVLSLQSGADGEDGGREYYLAEIDFDRKKVGSVYSNLNTGNNVCVFGRGIEKDFLMSDGTSVYEYDLENKSLVKLFQWMDFDINGDDMRSLSAVSGGIVAAAGKERDDTIGQSFLVRITNISETVSDKSQSGTTPGGVSDVPTEKQEIVLATLSMAYAAANPSAELLENATKSEIMNYCMSFYESSFVDWASGECHFDSPNFKELLGFVKGFPDEKENADGELASWPAKISRRDVLLYKTTLTSFSDFQVINAAFGDDRIWIGFPTPDKSPGHALHLSSVYAVTSRSRAAEGAWEFIEGYLAEEIGTDDVVGGFPSNRLELQKYIDSRFEYVTDSEGKPVLDEDGQPRYVRGTGGTLTWTIDGWSCDLHHETPEEIEQIRELLNAARRSDTFNGNGIIMMIISEEAEAFYRDQKSVDETAKIIQNRVNVYIKENKS